jgi:hypothetical protein
MSYIQRELDKIAVALRDPQSQERHQELYAAQQALVWALDPNCYRAPMDTINEVPTQPSTGTPAG